MLRLDYKVSLCFIIVSKYILTVIVSILVTAKEKKTTAVLQIEATEELNKRTRQQRPVKWWVGYC